MFRNNNIKYINHYYNNYDFSDALKYFTKQLNKLNPGGMSVNEIKAAIAGLEEQLTFANHRQEIEEVILGLDSDLKIHIMPNEEDSTKNICFIGYTNDFTDRFIVKNGIGVSENVDDGFDDEDILEY